MMISPQEAANLQLAKYGAIAATASAASEVFKGIAEIKNEEEYTDAITTWESAVNSFNQGIKSMPPDKNDLGELVFDADKVISMERDGRQKITNDIRANIKSGTVKARFDKAIALDKPDRDERLMNQVKQKEAEFIEVKAVSKIDDLVRAKSYPAAREKADASLGNGAISPVKHAAKMQYINETEEFDYFYGITNAEDFNQEDAEVALTAISQHEIDGETLNLSMQQLSPIRAKLLSRYAEVEAAQEEVIQDAQFMNYLDIQERIAKGENVTEQDLIQAARLGATNPSRGISQEDYERLQGDLDKGGNEKLATVGDTPQGWEYFSSEALEITNGPSLIPDPYNIGELDPEYDWDQRYNKFVKDITSPDSGLSYDTRQKLLLDVKTVRNDLIGDEQFKQIVNKGLSGVTGFRQDNITTMMASMESQFKDTIYIAEEFKIALTNERVRLGPGNRAELARFEEKQAPFYKLKINNKLLSKVGVKLGYPKEITDEFVGKMQDDMTNWLQDRLKNSPNTAARDVKTFKQVVDELERLNGIDIKSLMTPEEQRMAY